MNLVQAMRQVKYLADTAVWGEGAAAYVFPRVGADLADTSVKISDPQVPMSLLLEDLRCPGLLIGDAGATPDAENPLLKKQRISLTFVADDIEARWGELSLIGSHRDTTSGTSENRGLWEFIPPVLARLVRVGRESGIAVVSMADSEQGATLLGPKRTLRGKVHTIALWIYDSEAGEYPTVRGLSGSDSGGTITLTWTAPPARFDNPSRYALVIVKEDSAPTSVSDGDVLSVTASSGYTHAPGAGDWYYGVATVYDEGSGTRYGELVTTGAF